ncbi:helix-turn-helix transcriptional regulator [Saccharibacillus sp. CPCC 101409]|uniref:helix-turn-helix transcriptional regulator n=1 Tax=Saccharibacillus sp. CPCC 101409 TaxID=3058041 RepID=UPI002671CC13|nr:helix-turn-helix transcriptional regulator [Saccharibacillus sp. CPCC 101409]MDO3409871.1 helix-turn-helix transcriptional regulator [Saccharibacillus sp. CPCC 101409]
MNVHKTSLPAQTLGGFIKSRRERLQPAAAGIDPLPGRRRTPGLRREEVAYLANMSVTYYTWLEQGRDVHPSPEVLRGIGTALQMSRDELRHLFDLAEAAEPDPLGSGSGTSVRAQTAADVPAFLQGVIDSLPYPSIVTGELTDLLIWNRAAELVMGDFDTASSERPNMMRLIFTDPVYRERLVNAAEFAAYSVGIARGEYERNADKPGYREILDRLLSESEVFAELWEKHEIRQKRVEVARYRLPGTGLLEFQTHSAGEIDGRPDLHWCLFVPVPGSGTEEKMRELLNR